MSEALEDLFRNLNLTSREDTMNAEQVSEVVRAEVRRALSEQKIEFDRKILALQNQVTINKPKVEKYSRVTINPLTNCDITLDAIKSLPEFFGHQGTYVSWREAAHNAYELFRRYDGSERHYQAVTIIRNKVRGAADAVLSSFNTVLNFSAIISRLDFTYADKRPIYLIEQELSTLRQGSMSCLEFYDEVEKKLTLLANKTIMSYESGVADTINEKYRADALRVFISGLRKPLCDILFASRPSDLPSALALAQEVDANNERYAFAMNFANRFQEKPIRSQNPVNLRSPNLEHGVGHKNPHYSVGKQQNRYDSRPQNYGNTRKPFTNGNYSSQRRTEPMEVDPSISQFRNTASNPSQEQYGRPQGNIQKRTANSGRYTGPKIQRVNHLTDERESQNESTYNNEAEQVTENIETDEVNFLGQNPSFLGFQGH